MVLAAAVFLVDAAPRLAAPLGDSHDGRNGAMWASGARAIADDGLVESRLGAIATERITYAHHPPGLYVLAAAARGVGGDAELALRAPAAIASVASIALTWLLLRQLRMSTAAAAVGVSLLVGSQMFLLYGAQLNHEAISLPLALAALLIYARARDGARTPTIAAFAVGLASALVSWIGLLMCVAVVAVDEWTRRRSRHVRGRHDDHAVHVRWLGAGALVGAVATFAWLWWANGGLAEVWTAFRSRSGDRGAGLAAVIEAQSTYLGWGFPLWSLVVAAFGFGMLALRHRQPHPVHLLVVAVPAVYAVAFRSGAYFHSYWNYWLVITVALGGALAADMVADRTVARRGAYAFAAIALLLGPIVHTSPERASTVEGQSAGALASAFGTDEPLSTWPGVGEPAWWLDYYGRGQHAALTDDALRDTARRDADREVLVWRTTVERRNGTLTFDDLVPLALAVDGDYLVARAADLVRALDAHEPDAVGVARTG